MPWVGFEHTIQASERAKTVHAPERSATVAGRRGNYIKQNEKFLLVGLRQGPLYYVHKWEEEENIQIGSTVCKINLLSVFSDGTKNAARIVKILWQYEKIRKSDLFLIFTCNPRRI
jgi:hypothetical protein